MSGVDDRGNEERILFWIDRRPGAVWTVGRAVNPQLRATDDPLPDDVVFEGYELEEALERANEALEDDVVRPRVVRGPQVRVHGTADRPKRPGASVDPEDDPLLVPSVVYAGQCPLCDPPRVGPALH